MEEALALIEKIIEQHKAIMGSVQALEQVANDVEAMAGLEETKKAFMPGRFDQKQGLQKLQELLETIDKGLQEHFNYEETGLLSAFEKHGGEELAAALHSLLLEHEDLKNRFILSRNHVAELTGGGLARHVWEASAYDMRAYISHTLKLLGAHANREHELLLTLQNQLRQEGKRE